MTDHTTEKPPDNRGLLSPYYCERHEHCCTFFRSRIRRRWVVCVSSRQTRARRPRIRSQGLRLRCVDLGRSVRFWFRCDASLWPRHRWLAADPEPWFVRLRAARGRIDELANRRQPRSRPESVTPRRTRRHDDRFVVLAMAVTSISYTSGEPSDT